MRLGKNGLPKWKKYTTQRLERLIQKVPFTKNRMLYVLAYKTEEISFMDDTGGFVFKGHNGKFRVLIGLKDTWGRQGETLVHESVHIFYRVQGSSGGLYPDEKEREDIVEKEGLKFYQQNKDFVDCNLDLMYRRWQGLI